MKLIGAGNPDDKRYKTWAVSRLGVKYGPWWARAFEVHSANNCRIDKCINNGDMDRFIFLF